MERNNRWGILGAGNIAGKFAAALNYVEGNEVYAIASRDLDKAQAFADMHRASQVYDDYGKLAADPDVNIIYVATPHAFHFEQTLMCLECRKPVLCEKPMALNFRQVNEMANSARSRKLFLMEGMWSRFMPSINKVLELISADVIGPVQYVRADFGFQAPYNPGGRLYDLRLGGGSLLDVGIYPLFLTSLLLGEPARVQSLARFADTGADEYCSMQFQYDGGQVANIFSAISIKTSLTAEIAGPKGRIFLHPPFYKSSLVTLDGNNGEQGSFSFPHELNGFEYQVRHVSDCLARGLTESPLMPLDFSLQLSRTMDIIRRQCGIVYNGD